MSGKTPSDSETVEDFAARRSDAERDHETDDASAPPEPEPIEPEPTEPSPEEEDDEPAREGSLAGRLLTLLVVFLLGAGVALWAAPRLAPIMPPSIAQILTPTVDQMTMRMDMLESDLRAEISEAIPDMAAMEARLAELIAPTEAALAERSEELTALTDQLGAVDVITMEERLSVLETRIDGAIAELAALDPEVDELSEVAAQGLAAYRADLEGVRAEIASVAERLGQVTARVDTVLEDSADAREAAAEAAAAREAAAAAAEIQEARATIAQQIGEGDGFADALATWSAAAGRDAPAALAAVAADGVATLSELRSSFGASATEALRAEAAAASSEGGLLGQITNRIPARSLEPRPGDDADAILSRAEAALRRDDLDAALSELAALPELARPGMSDWIATATARRDALAALPDLAP